MAAGTLSPSPKQFFWNVTTGAPLANGLVYTVTSGGAYPGSAVATYTDSAALIPNANPIQLNAAGYATIYLKPGTTYKYLVYDANGITSGTLQYTQDGIEAIPTSTTGLDAVGTAGDAFAIGQVGYLSDGSGSKTPGLFYLADSANTYSSTLPAIIAVATTAIALGATGVFRQGGIVSGLSGLTAGSKYYVGTAGALTVTAPANSRQVGVADSTTTQLDIAPSPALSNAVLVSPTISTSILTPASAGLGFGVCQGRLTLTTATPVTSADVTGASAVTVYFTPYLGNNIGLYDGSTNWTILPFAEISIAVPASTSQMYDVWVYNNSGVAALELLAWTNDTTRATALVLQNGVLVKTGATTRRYLGSFRTTTVSGQTEDSLTKRYVWNYTNRVRRALQRFEGSATWAYTTATVRQANGSASNQVDTVVGVQEALLDLALNVAVNNSTGGNNVSAGIGENSTTTYTAGGVTAPITSGSNISSIACRLAKYPAVGRNFYAWNEWSTAAGTTTWIGALGTVGSTITAGLIGWIDG